MAASYDRRINLFINGKEVSNDVKSIKAEMTKLVNEQARMTIGSKEYIAAASNIRQLKGILAEHNQQIAAVQKSWTFKGMADNLNKYFGLITAGIASITGVIMGFKELVKTFNDFEERVDNLSSLTGLAGEELAWLTQKAKELSTATLEGGVKVKQGAQDIIDAFTKVGSARPELLQDKEALAQVAQEAIILSNAAKTELQPAIEALTMVMNQYNVPASEARRIINVLGASSKAGAGEIPYLTQAFEKSGTVAADAGISIESLAAAIETLAPRISQPEIAGRSLKGVLLKLQTGADDTNPAIVGLSTALENLGKKNYGVTRLTKLFGVENITTAKILIDNVGQLKKYETAVTGTNVAVEQAIINTDNNNAKLAQAKNRINIISIELGGKLAPALTLVTGWFGKTLAVISALIDVFVKYKTIIVTASASIAAYAIAIKVASYWDNIHYGFLVAKNAVINAYRFTVDVLTGRITLATVAQNAWNLAQKMNPIGIIIGLLAAAGAALYLYSRKLSDAEVAQKALNDLQTEAENSIVDERVAMEQLMRIAQNETLSKEARADAIRKLNELSPDYLGGLTLETINTDKAKIATDKYIDSLIKKAEIEAATENLKESQKKIQQLQAGEGEKAGFLQTVGKMFTQKGGNGYASANKQATLENQQKAIGDEQIRSKVFQDKIDSLVKKSDGSSLSSGSSMSSIGGGSASGDIKGDAAKEKKTREAAMNTLKAAFDDRLLIIKNAYANEQITKEQFEKRMELATLTHLEAQKQLLILQKQDTTEVELQIADARIKIHEETFSEIQKRWEDTNKLMEGYTERQDQINENSIDSIIKLGDELIEEHNRIEKETDQTNEKKAQSYMDLAVSIGDSFADTLMSQEQDFGQFLRNTLVMALDALEKMLLMSMAEAAIKDIATKGFLGIATAAAKIVLMKAAFGTAKAMILGGGKGKAEGGFTEPGGKYEPAGIVHKGEYVIPQEGVNNPALAPYINMFESARRNQSLARLDIRPTVMAGASAGYASGGLAGGGSVSGGASVVTINSDPEMKALLIKLARRLDKPIKATVNKYGTNGISDAMDDISSFKSTVLK
jgi:TP901 family phage tail tape measure protein